MDALRDRVLKLFEYFQAYENSDGLLEKLPGWVFVEWSKANEFVQDVNYPSNMLYAGGSGGGRPHVQPAAICAQRPIRSVTSCGNSRLTASSSSTTPCGRMASWT